MTELTTREAHTRTYFKDGKRAEVEVDSNGVVQVSEELFDILLRVAGYYEVSPLPVGVDSLDLDQI